VELRGIDLHFLPVTKKTMNYLFSTTATQIDYCPQTYRLYPVINGISHGLKSVHRTLFAPAFALVPPFRFPFSAPPIKMPPEGGIFIGGAEGNRTPVRKQLGKNFSGCSLLFTFPHPDENKHPAEFSSFIMRGMGKAYHTHGLYSNHTRARLVDLPGRMGA